MTKLTIWLKNGDYRILYFVNLKIKSPVLDWWMSKITHLGGVSFTVGTLLLLILFLDDFGMDGLIALTTSHLLVQVLKRSFSRRRPYLTEEKVHLSHHPLQDYSFPSGHTTAIFTLATTISLTVPWLIILLFPVACIVAMSRIYLGLHYPTDVGIGALIGFLFAFGIHFL